MLICFLSFSAALLLYYSFKNANYSSFIVQFSFSRIQIVIQQDMVEYANRREQNKKQIKKYMRSMHQRFCCPQWKG